MKASLLLNQQSIVRKHDIRIFLPKVKALAPELWPDEFFIPPHIANVFGGENRSIDHYVERLWEFGQPDNRYNLNGFMYFTTDIFRLDQLVYVTRRLCQPLEAHFSEAVAGRAELADLSIRKWLVEGDREATRLGGVLERILAGKEGEDLKRDLLDWNLSFAPVDYDHPPLPMGGGSSAPVLVRSLIDPLASQHSSDWQMADDLWAWVKENQMLVKDDIKRVEIQREQVIRSRGSRRR